MIRFLRAHGEIEGRLAEKNRGLKSVYTASKKDLNKYLSMGCAESGCGGRIELLRDEQMPELIKGYRCVKCGLTTFYNGYIFHVDG